MTTPDRIFAAEQALRGDLSGWLHDHTEQEGECMIWQGGIDHDGIPYMKLPGAYPRQQPPKRKNTTVRRAVWEEFHHKMVPQKHKVWCRSSCAPGCINPEHLLSGTQKLRCSQLAQSGKLKRDIAVAAKCAELRRAEQSPLTWDDVDAIRKAVSAAPSARNAPGVVGKTAIKLQLAELYGMTLAGIDDICHGRRWAGPRPASETGAFGAMAYQLGLVR
jgi:hypothetical protein